MNPYLIAMALLGVLLGAAAITYIIARRSQVCDHLYWPVQGPDGKFVGQECSLCGQFNSLDDVRRMLG